MSKNISIGGKSYEISDEIAEQIDELIEDEETDELIEDEETIEVENFNDFIGKKLAFQCARYIYFGKVEKVNGTFIELSDASIVYETGEFSAKEASDIQGLPKEKVYLMRQSIETIYPTNWR